MRWIVRCAVCKDEMKSGANSTMTWEAASRAVGQDGWRIIERKGTRVLHCPKCAKEPAR